MKDTRTASPPAMTGASVDGHKAPPPDAHKLASMRADWERAVDEKRAPFAMVADAHAALRGVAPYADLASDAEVLFPKLYKVFPGDGRVVHVYWPEQMTGGLAVTAHRRGWLRRVFAIGREEDTYDLHAVYDAQKVTSPELLKLAWELDQLMIDVRLFLVGDPQRFAADTIYSRYTDVIARMDEEVRGRRAAPPLTPYRRRTDVRDEGLEALKSSVGDAHRLVYTSAERQAAGRYLGGIVVGLIFALLAAGITAVFVGSTEFAGGLSLRTLLGCLIAGAAAALLSVLLRIGKGSLRVLWRTGRAMTFLLGLFRPVVGAICGGIAYLFLQSNLVSFVGALDNKGETFYWAVSVIAGFSERFVPDMLTRAADQAVPPAESARPGDTAAAKQPADRNDANTSVPTHA